MAESSEEPFQIGATVSASRPRLVLKHGDIFAVLDNHGAIGASAGGPDGLFLNDTRYLSTFDLLIGGMQPLLLGSGVRDNNLTLEVDLTNPDIDADSRRLLSKDSLHIRKSFFVHGNHAFLRLGIHNHAMEAIDVPLVLTFSADFSDIFEVRGMRRERRGSVKTDHTDGCARFRYRALDGVEIMTTLRFDPAPDALGTHTAHYRLTLAPGQHRSIFVAVFCDDEDNRTIPFLRNLLATSRGERLRRSTRLSLGTSSDSVNEIVTRSFNDLNMLITDTEQGPYPYAGTPWYSTTFGRDGIITALQTLWCQPELAKGVLRRLAYLQATDDDPLNDAQPGKILHEMRSGEMARLREVPFSRYYGSVDATPLFVLLAARYFERTNDLATIRTLWPNIERALAWIDGPADCDRDGFVEYMRATEQGLQNQGWKDSFDSIFHADGQLATGPIALAEVQAYVHAAKLGLAKCARALGREQRAARLEADAASLFERFNAAFWCEEISSYAIALDGAKRPCRIRSSNAGHVLFGALATRERAEQTRRMLLGADMMSGWGIRTVARGESRYNPMSYHNGSIWPHDNALIAMGLRRYGLVGDIETIASAMFGAASTMDLRRLPELYCGFGRTKGRGPTLYPVACAPQAWAAATPLSLIDSLLGLQFEPAGNRISLASPRLPSFIDMMVIRNLALADNRLDFAIFRTNSELSIQVLDNPGKIELSIKP